MTKKKRVGFYRIAQKGWCDKNITNKMNVVKIGKKSKEKKTLQVQLKIAILVKYRTFLCTKIYVDILPPPIPFIASLAVNTECFTLEKLKYAWDSDFLIIVWLLSRKMPINLFPCTFVKVRWNRLING